MVLTATRTESTSVPLCFASTILSATSTLRPRALKVSGSAAPSASASAKISAASSDLSGFATKPASASVSSTPTSLAFSTFCFVIGAFSAFSAVFSIRSGSLIPSSSISIVTSTTSPMFSDRDSTNDEVSLPMSA